MALTYKEFFQSVRQKFEGGTVILFNFAVITVIEEIDTSNNSNWQEEEITTKSVEVFYKIFVFALKARASQLSSIPDDPVWQQATDIITILRTMLMEIHSNGPSLEEVTIMSPTRGMHEAGDVMTVDTNDGEGRVTFPSNN